jgi:enediyne biosynthesis protein E4
MMMRILAIVLMAGAAQADDVVIPQFADQGATAGITSVYAGDWQYMVGGGVAVFDCNDDGFQDMLLAGGAAPATFYRNASATSGSLAFVAQTSGLEMDAVTGAYPLDVDGDGITDVALLRVGENHLMRGLGDCRFASANAAWGFDGGNAWSTAFAATWEKDASWPTLAVGNYIDPREEDFPWGSCTDNWLHRPEGASFARPVPLTPSFCALSMLFTDWDRSGTPSLRVSNDREYYRGGQEQLWRMTPGTTPALYTEADGWQRLRIWGMGIASSDITGDGYPDYFLTSMADNKFQTITPPADGSLVPRFADVAYAKGITAHRPYTGTDLYPSTAWHAQFDDVNNDGLTDLFIAKGNVSEMPDFAQADPNNLLLQKPDGTFTEAGDRAGVASMATSRGAALADFNMDGLLDLVVVNRWKPAELWRNVTPDPLPWAAVRLQQPGANRDAIGAWVEVRRGDVVTRREVTVGGGHAGGQLGWLHFGLGNADTADVRVIWPGGGTDDWQPLPVRAFSILAPGQAAQPFPLP